jgi:Arc/MetJ-type ribon-helix-helix transcriptional regulator
MSQEPPRVLTEAQRQFLDARVADGLYEDPASVVQAGLDLLEEQEREEQQRLEYLRSEVQEALAEVDRGEVIEFKNDEEQHQFFKDMFDKAVANHQASQRC